MTQPPTLNPKQQQKLQEIADAKWLQEVFEQVKPLYPPDATISWGYRTDEELRQRIARDIARARSYKFKANKDAFAYLQVSLELGEGFENNPRYPWAHIIVNEPPSQKIPGEDFSTAIDSRGDRLLKAMKAQRILNEAGVEAWK